MGLTICIIEDDMVSQFASVYSIEQFDKEAKVIMCNSAEEGLNLLFGLIQDKKPLPDALFLDLTMPGLNGWEFLERLKEIQYKWVQMEIYILSAFSNSKDREKAKQHSMIQGYYDKPLTKSILKKIFQPEKIDQKG